MKNNPATLQAAYAAKRQAHTGAATMQLRIYRVTLEDGRQVTERCIGASQVVAQWPDLLRLEWVKDEVGQFW